MNEFVLPQLGLRAPERVTFLAIDDYLLPLKKNLCYYMSQPEVHLQPVLVPSREDPNAPDYIATHFYGTVLLDEGKYRMWYYGLGQGEKPGELQEGPICYAESDDGIEWVKPHLGQVTHKGSRQNNAIALPDPRTEGVELIKEADDPDPQRRYKMVYESFVRSRKFPTIRTATSPDGLRWVAGPETLIPESMEQSSFYRFSGYYFVNAQMWPRGEGGRRRGRQGFAVVSPDFEHWLVESVESFALPEPADVGEGGNDKAYDQVHLGVGAASLGNVLVGLYCMWHARPYPTPGDWFGQGTTSGDLGLVVSNDGMHFREPVKGRVYLSQYDSPVTPAASATYPTILEQANGILNVGDETRIYHGRWRNARYVNPSIPVEKGAEDAYYRQDYYAEVALATLPRDRWGALGLFPDQQEGTVWSAPVTLPEKGCELLLNADGAHQMRVEVSDERFGLLPGCSGEQSGSSAEVSGLACAVSWPGRPLAALGGETVRFRIHLQRSHGLEPRLYAIYAEQRP
jgi:hypothetical protein